VISYIFNEDVFSTTSFGISPNGVLDRFGGVLTNGGGYPDTFAGKELRGVGVLVAGAPGSRPAARNLSSKEFGSGTGVEAMDTGGGLKG
jgi:hypothetical protein